MKSVDFIKRDKDVMMDVYDRYPVVIEKGRGAVAYDVDGKSYIDFAAGIAVNALGYADKGWLKAVSEQAKKVGHICNLYYNPTSVELAEKLTAAAGMKRVFFANSGAEANEGAIKTARKYSEDKYGPERNVIITLNNSFHGRTVTTLAATGQEAFHKYFLPLTEGFRCPVENTLEAIKDAVDENVCAVMIELVQGEGGVNILDKELVDGIQTLCDERDVLLIVDEVQTGVMRTGKFLASQRYGIRPDIISMAKGLGGGLPIGAVLVGEKCEFVMTHGMHGSTFGGNPIVCAGALEVVNRVTAPGFEKEVNEKGEYIRNKLAGFANVKNVRGLGLFIAFDLIDGEARVFSRKAAENGLLTLTAKTSVRLLPPLTISYKEIDKGLAIIEKTLKSEE